MAAGISWRVGLNQIGKSSLLSIRALAIGYLIFFPTSLAISQPSGPLIATNTVNINSFPSVMDSFDSSDPAYSVWHTNFFNGHTYGTYTNTLRKDNASVAIDGTSLFVGGASIYGSIYTGPGGSAGIFVDGAVGDWDWIGPNPSIPLNNGIQPGHLGSNMNFRLPGVKLPTPQNWLAVPAPTNHTIVVSGQIYTNNNTPYNPGKPSSYTIGGVVYSLIITNIAGQPGTPTNKVYYLYPNQLTQGLFIGTTNVVLYLPKGANNFTADYLTINTNANIEIYSGANMDTSGGLVNNLSQYAPALKIYGLTNCTSIVFGNYTLLATWLYAPNASVSFNAGGSAACDVVGAIMAGDIRINGHFNFHFDEALAPSLPIPPWIWSQPKNQAVQSGSNATFTIFAGGTKPQWTQWFYNQNTPVPAGVDSTLTLPDVKVSDSGDYSVILTNSFGSVTSSPAILFVYTNAAQLAAQMDTPIADGLGNFQCNVTGLNGFDYIVQASTNLTDWTSLQTNAVPFNFTDTNSEAFAERFYRVLFPSSP